MNQSNAHSNSNYARYVPHDMQPTKPTTKFFAGDEDVIDDEMHGSERVARWGSRSKSGNRN